MAKTKKDKITEIPTDVEVLPSHSFCEGCKNTDIRAIKDTMLLMLNCLHEVADSFEIDYENWQDMIKKLRKFARANEVAKELKEAKKKPKLGKRYGGKG